MNCNKCIENLDQFLDGELEGLSLREFQSHTTECGDCGAALKKNKKLRQALKAMPLLPPEQGFYDRALEQTVKTTQRNEVLYWASAGIGGAIAASVIAWLVLALPPDYQENIEQQQLAGVSISLNVEKTVRVSFESNRELKDATLILQLPPGVEISGFENRSEIKWATNVHRGTNILALPIVVRSGLGGTIIARVEHAGKAKSFQFAVKVI